MNEFLIALQPAIIAIVAAILSGVGIAGVLALLKARDVLVVKVGADTYNAARTFAIGVYTLLEDQFAGVIKAGEAKKAEMEKMLLAQFPTLTQAELDAINKDVWAAMQNAFGDLFGPAE
jgi:hypothetical protein